MPSYYYSFSHIIIFIRILPLLLNLKFEKEERISCQEDVRWWLHVLYTFESSLWSEIAVCVNKSCECLRDSILRLLKTLSKSTGRKICPRLTPANTNSDTFPSFLLRLDIIMCTFVWISSFQAIIILCSSSNLWLSKSSLNVLWEFQSLHSSLHLFSHSFSWLRKSFCFGRRETNKKEASRMFIYQETCLFSAFVFTSELQHIHLHFLLVFQRIWETHTLLSPFYLIRNHDDSQLTS